MNRSVYVVSKETYIATAVNYTNKMYIALIPVGNVIKNNTHSLVYGHR